MNFIAFSNQKNNNQTMKQLQNDKFDFMYNLIVFIIP